MLVGEPRGHRDAGLAVVLLERRGREPDRAGLHRLDDEALHLRHLGLGRGAVRRLLAERPCAHRRVPHEGGDVRHHALALQHVEVLRVGLEVPVDAGHQRFERHALDVGEVAQRAVAIALAARCDGEAAVAHHHGGHTQGDRRCGPWIPGELGVEVGVDVDDARGEREAMRIDGIPCAADVVSDLGDPAVLHSDASFHGIVAESVEDTGVPDYEVMHCVVPFP